MEGEYYPEDQSDTSADRPATESSETEHDYETFLVPKSAFKEGFGPGDKETIECVHAYEDQLEMRCTGGEKKDMPKKSTMDESMDKMDAMAEKEG